MLYLSSWLFALLLACAAFTVQAQTVDINTASAQELESIKGIGPKKAEAIIKYRTEHGAFQSVEDLVNVPGIGPKTLNSMKDKLSVGGATGAGVRAPSGSAPMPGGLTTPPPGSRYTAPATTPPPGAKPQQQ